MNLVKNSALLLTVLSAFTLASCANNKRELSKNDAFKWIEEHYPERKETTVNQTDIAWDYRDNKTNSLTTPKIEQWGELQEKKLNDLTADYLEHSYSGITAEDAKKEHSNVTVDGTPILYPSEFWTKSWTVVQFKNQFDSGDHEHKFYVIGNELEVVCNENEPLEWDFGNYDIGTPIDGDLTTHHFNSNGFLTKYSEVITAKSAAFELFDKSGGNPIEGSKAELGKLNLKIEVTPKSTK